MAETDKSAAGKGWTDKERLTYLFALIENSNVKFDYINTPRPADRTLVACRLMITRLKATLKNELAALKASEDIEASPTKKTTTASKKTGSAATSTPRKRKTKANNDDDDEMEAATLAAKRGRKKNVKVEEEVQAFADDEDEFGV